MSIIDIIRQEIERRITDNTFGAKLELMDILAWLDTIESGSYEKQSDQEPEVDLDSKVTFDCISKKVTMTIRELINYYIDRECCDVAEECGF